MSLICIYLVQYLFYLLQPSLLLEASLSSRRTIQSQIIRKLNPMKSPRQPPQSATRDAKENASCSFLTRTESLANTGNSSVLALGISVGVWAICIFNHHGIVKIDSCSYKLIIEYLHTLYSINVQGIKQYNLFMIQLFITCFCLNYYKGGINTTYSDSLSILLLIFLFSYNWI